MMIVRAIEDSWILMMDAVVVGVVVITQITTIMVTTTTISHHFNLSLSAVFSSLISFHMLRMSVVLLTIVTCVVKYIKTCII